jgi:hypothetical protein
MCRCVRVGEGAAQRRRSCKCTHVSLLKYFVDVGRYIGTILDQPRYGVVIVMSEQRGDREHPLRKRTNYRGDRAHRSDVVARSKGGILTVV